MSALPAAVAAPDSVEVLPPLAGRRRIAAVLRKDPAALAGLTVIALFLLVAIAGPWIAPYPAQGAGVVDPNTLTLPPSAAHPFGTDDLGRDLLSRVTIGARPTVLVPFAVVILAVSIGAPLGAVAGYLGGWADRIIMRLTDLFLAFPSLLLAMAIAAALGPSLTHAAIALVVSWWPWYTRLVRGVASSLRQRDFVEAARSIGVTNRTIIRRHILPNTITPILVQASVDLGIVVLAMGGLAFLGLGTQPPGADWGLMISEGRASVLSFWWISAVPGLAMLLLVMSFNLVGDALRDVFDPRQYR
ncbi:MAG TPA: ABC transporter permease [Streptosporangiaceae bacterium]|nr:ABC transporter permease [Streptosporangiaceae bacterium]